MLVTHVPPCTPVGQHASVLPTAHASQALQRSWFCNKRCLDIGCNAGAVSLALAERFHAQTVLGVDIDASLIEQATRQGGPLV